MHVFGAKGMSNDAFDDDVGSAVLNNPKASLGNRLPPLQSIDTTKPTKSKSKSPRPRLESDQSYTNGEALTNGHGDTTLKPAHRKKKSKRRPNSAESEPRTANGLEINGHDQELTPSPRSENPAESRRKKRQQGAALDKKEPIIVEGQQAPASPVSTTVNGDQAPAKPPRDKPPSVSSTHDTPDNLEQVVRPKDPNRNVEAIVMVENPVTVRDTLKPDVIPRTASVSSLRKLETDGGLHEEIDEIQMAPEAKEAGSRSPRPILKQTSHEDHVTNMFMAGSRPPSASSTKQTVRISDEVTYSDTNLKKSANRSRPRSAGRPKSAQNGHAAGPPDYKIQVLQDAIDGKYDNWRLKRTTQRKISPHFKTSIFTMIFCGIFPGAAALYFAFQTRTAIRKGKL